MASRGRSAILKMVQRDPKLAQAVAAMDQRLSGLNLTASDIEEIIKVVEVVLRNPDKYQQIVQAAVRDGLLQPNLAPPQFDRMFLMSLLAALYGVQDKLKTRGFARGGLAKLASAGRGGDTMLAHINPREAAVLRAMGGSGTVNPNTGLREYKGDSNRVLGAIVPIVVDMFAPSFGSWLSSATNGALSAETGTMLGGAALGAAGSAATGGNAWQGAAVGALNNGAGGYLGRTLAPNMSAANQNLLGTALVGGASGALTGQGFGQGAMQGAVGGMVGNATSGMGSRIASGGSAAGNMYAAGYDPTTSAYAGLAAALTARQSPADAAVQQAAQGAPAAPVGGPAAAPQPPAQAPQQTPQGGGLNQLMPLLAMAGSLNSAPPAAQTAVHQLTPQQQEYFNRPSVQWDWARMQQDATQAGMNLQQFMAQNWNAVASGYYNVPAPRQPQPGQQPPTNMARGGLSQVAYLARGSGSGRADTIEARLSDGEFVLDAETVSLLGDGSNEEGAKRLNAMREEIRRHKGRQLSKGKFSANAKSPLAYLKGER